ncbi:MAG: ATP-binding protein [Thermoleophilaceae bacterium]
MPTDQFPALRPTQVKLRLSSGPEAVSLARHCLDDFQAELGHALFEDMRLLISEVMTNAVRHASAAGDGTVTVELSVGTDLVRACVTDPGPGFEATPREPGDDPGSGWGLFLVEQLSDRWGVELAGGTSVWFEIDRRANGQELAA